MVTWITEGENERDHRQRACRGPNDYNDRLTLSHACTVQFVITPVFYFTSSIKIWNSLYLIIHMLSQY